MHKSIADKTASPNVGGMELNREALKEMGLTDEQIDKVMASHGSVVNATKGELAAMTTERDDLEGQLTDRDAQLEGLKKIDAEGLQQKITELQSANETTKSEYEEKLHTQAFDFKLQEALTGAKVRNPKALKALLDTDKIKLDGETLLGLDDQLKTLKESDDYLFESGETPPNSPAIVTGGNPNGGSATGTKSIADMSYQELADLKATNPASFAELTK